MPRVDDLFPSRFVSAADLAKMTDPNAPFVIKSLAQEECINPRTKQKEMKWVVYFRNCQKGHRLRKSEVKDLAKTLGATTEEWVGKCVTLRAVATSTGAGVRMIAGGKTRTPGRPTPAAESAAPAPAAEPAGEGNLAFSGEIPEDGK